MVHRTLQGQHDYWSFKPTLRKISIMKNLSLVLMLAAISVLLWGCPYKSFVPLSTPTEYVNKQVIGKWIPKSEESKENPEYYVIAKNDTVSYNVDHFQYNQEDSSYSAKSYVCWSTRIESIMFMNVQKHGEKEVMLYRLDVKGDELMTLYEVTSNIDERFDDSEKMLAFFKTHKNTSFFYNSDEVDLIKIAE